jgi:hypothetical protein
VRQLRWINDPSGGMPVHLQAEVDVEFESSIGEQRQSLRDFPPSRKPAGALLENQPDSAHAPPPGRSSDEPRPFFLAQYLVFERYYPDFAAPKPDWRFYDRFAADWDHFFFRDSRRFESALHAAHMFACFRHVQHAFRHTFFSIIGNSMPAARLRVRLAVGLYPRSPPPWARAVQEMPDFPKLITGPSGTGKELVARAIANSRYVAFEPHIRRCQPFRRHGTHSN